MTRKSLPVVLAWLTLPAALSAGEAAEPDTTAIDMLHLPDVEVTAEALNKDVASTAPLFTLSQERMKVMGVSDIADALHRLPGLNLRDYGGAGGMKTVSVRGFGATHTGVVYDGVMLSDCQSGKIDLSRYSLDNVGEISMVIGDNSDIFVPAKAAASAATISINTLAVPDGSDKLWHLRTQVKFGSFGMVSPFVRVGKNVSDNFAIALTGQYTYADNDYPFTLRNGNLVTHERRRNSRMNSGNGELAFAWRPAGGHTIDGKVYYYDNSRQLPGAVVLYNPVCNEHLRERNFFGQVRYINRVNSKWQWKALAKFNWDASLYHDEDGKYPGGVYNENYWQREVYVTGSVMWTPSAKWAVDYSADYAFNNLSSNQPQEPYPYRHSLLQSVTGRFKTSNFLATARLLYSYYDNEVRYGESARDANRVSPSASISWRPIASEMLFVRASYKNIFRMPTFNDSYFYHMGSTSLRPETTDQLNIGVTWQPGLPRILSGVVTVDAYYNKIKDKIVAIPQNMFIWNMTNLDKARAFGVDATLDFTFTLARRHTLNVAGNYSYQRVQPRTHRDNPDYNKQLAYTPRHSGAFSVGYENPWVNLSVHGFGTGCRFGTNSNLPMSRVAGYMDFGATAWRSLRFGAHSMELRADVLNIFNKQYYVVARYPMPGRAWKVTLTYNFN